MGRNKLQCLTTCCRATRPLAPGSLLQARDPVHATAELKGRSRGPHRRRARHGAPSAARCSLTEANVGGWTCRAVGPPDGTCNMDAFISKAAAGPCRVLGAWTWTARTRKKPGNYERTGAPSTARHGLRGPGRRAVRSAYFIGNRASSFSCERGHDPPRARRVRRPARDRVMDFPVQGHLMNNSLRRAPSRKAAAPRRPRPRRRPGCPRRPCRTTPRARRRRAVAATPRSSGWTRGHGPPAADLGNTKHRRAAERRRHEEGQCRRRLFRRHHGSRGDRRREWRGPRRSPRRRRPRRARRGPGRRSAAPASIVAATKTAP